RSRAVLPAIRRARSPRRAHLRRRGRTGEPPRRPSHPRSLHSFASWPLTSSQFPLARLKRGLHLALDGALADAEPLGDLFVAALVRHAQQEHLATARRQTEQRPFDYA